MMRFPTPPGNSKDAWAEWGRVFARSAERAIQAITQDFQRKADPPVLPVVPLTDIGSYKVAPAGRMLLIDDGGTRFPVWSSGTAWYRMDGTPL